MPSCPIRCFGKHRRFAEQWSPERFSRRAEKIGPTTTALITEVLHARGHTEQSHRSCHGILRLAKSWSDAWIEAAAQRKAGTRARGRPNCELARVDGGLCKGKGRPDGAGSWRPVPGRSADALTVSETANHVALRDDTPFPAFEEGRAASEDEVTVGQRKLSLLLDRNEGEPQDFAKAAAWFREAAAQGNLEAQVLLADLYADEFSEYFSYRKARKWLCRAARQGEVSAQAELGVLYYKGRGAKRRRKKAVA